MAQYQHHKRQYNSLEEKLAFFKTRNQMVQQSYSPLQQQKQKKKPRPSDQGLHLSSIFFIFKTNLWTYF